jgi:hypothetical protein
MVFLLRVPSVEKKASNNAILGIRLRVMKGDTKGMMEDEDVLKTSLNLTSS